jgi:hypothetical protein
VTGDKYAAQWVVEAFSKVDIKYLPEQCPLTFGGSVS